MNDRAMRISILLGLMPLYCYVWFVVGTFAGKVNIAEPIGVGTGFATLMVVGLVLFLWQDYVEWVWSTMRATLFLGGIVVGQILFWKPFWTYTGCAAEFYNGIQCWSQTAILLSTWCTGSAMSWWGFANLKRDVRRPRSINGRRQMTPGIARLAVGLALIPLIAGIFFIVTIAAEKMIGPGGNWVVAIGCEAASLVSVIAWLAIWKRQVRWAPATVTATAIFAILMFVAPFGVLVNATGSVDEIVIVFSPLLALALWFAGTAFVWRKKTGAAGVPDLFECDVPKPAPLCPECGYNLTGLCDVRCPECGWTSTVEKIVEIELARALALD